MHELQLKHIYNWDWNETLQIKEEVQKIDYCVDMSKGTSLENQ